MENETDRMQLAHWRRTIAELYADIRRESDAVKAWRQLQKTRNALFQTHPQTPLNEQQKASFSTLPYFAYDPDFCVVGELDKRVVNDSFEVDLPQDGRFQYTRIAKIHFDIKAQPAELSLYWVEGYGGGLFLPFRDATNSVTTYGGGRYLYDAIKGADLGAGNDTILLDFNFAYNPSCAYNDQWVCPLAPPENWLTLSIHAGEKAFAPGKLNTEN